MRHNPFTTGKSKRQYSETLKDLAAKKKREEVLAAGAAALIANLQVLRVQVAKELERLHDLFQSFRKHAHDSGFHHNDILDKENLSKADLEAMAMMDDLSPELKAMLDKYIEVQEQIESLNKQIDDTENQLQYIHAQQQELQQQIEENEQQQEQLKQETVEVVFEELSNHFQDAAPSKEEVQEMMTTDVKIEEMDEMDPAARQAIEDSLEEQYPTSVSTPDDEQQKTEQPHAHRMSNERMYHLAPMAVKFVIGFKRHCIKEKLEDARDEQAQLALIRELVRRDAFLGALITGNVNQREVLQQIDNQILQKHQEIQALNQGLQELKQVEHTLEEQLNQTSAFKQYGFGSK